MHSCIVAAAVLGWFTYKHKPPPVTTLAIEATVVDERALKEPVPPRRPANPRRPQPEPPPVEEQGPPKPDPAEVERKQEEERLAQEKLRAGEARAAEEGRGQESAGTAETGRREEAAGAARSEKKEAEKQAAAKAAAEKAAAEKAAADKKAAEKKKADEAAAAKKAAEEKARVAREAELRRSLEAEERGNALRNSDEAARWHAQIVARIQRAWIQPPSARAGHRRVSSSVSQVPGGEVTAVRVNSCNVDDAALRESVENAVYRASPLPPPPDPALFERNLELTFAPQ